MSSFLTNASATLSPPGGLFLFPWLERVFSTCSVSFWIIAPVRSLQNGERLLI